MKRNIKMSMKMTPRLIAAIVAFLILISSVVFIIASKYSNTAVIDKPEVDGTNSVIPDFKVTENKDIYKDDNDNVEDIYITVVGNTEWTLGDINTYRYQWELVDQVKPTVEVRFDTQKPSSITSGLKANAVMQPRGHANSEAIQKSLKITLFKNGGLWKGQRVINLNKHTYDLTRVRNKLSFDYFKLIPEVFSFRMQFCHVYIRDLTSKNKDFVDYGLFTHVEQPNNQYLKSHGIAQSAYMYKAEYFEFFRYPDKLKNVDDPAYDRKAFEEVLGIMGVEDHRRLISMLEDVNNENININDVIDKHFDRENYITWMAINILLGNHDTNSQNFILLSPITSNKWYFIPWDYDGAWGFDSQTGSTNGYGSWQKEGISNYWGVAFHKRFFKEPSNLNDLSEKIDELAKIFNKERTEEFLKKYYEATNKYVKSVPDIKYLPAGVADYEKEYKKIPSIIEEDRKTFYDNIQKPMPVYLGEPVKNKNIYEFVWDESYDFQGDDLYYDFKVSTNPEFTNIVAEKKKLKETSVKINVPKKGKYYWKVDIYDSKGNHQIAFDYYRNSSGNKYFGIREFIVE